MMIRGGTAFWTLFLLVAAVTVPYYTSALASASQSSYDVVIIGGGAAGLTAAKVASTFGKSTVIVEQARMGGYCTWTGCVPSKSLIAAAKAAHTIRTAPTKFGGIQTSGNDLQIDMKAIKDKIRAKIQHIHDEDDSPQAMAKLGIDTIVGKKATFVDDKTLQLSTVGKNDNDNDNDTSLLHAKMGIVIATGASPMEPSDDLIQGLSTVPFLTYEQIFDLEEVPKRLTVVGGGPIGCELAQAFGRLGATVTHVAETLLEREEPEVSETLEKVFAKEGIQRCKGKVVKVEKDGNGGHKFTYQTSDGSKTGTGDLLLIAVGRKPNTAGFGLEEIGVQLNKDDNNCIETNDKMQTSVKRIYAAGDCTAKQQYTHYAGFQGGIAARNIVLPFSDKGVKAPEQIPSATYTAPEVSSIGLRHAQAVEEYGAKNVGVAVQSMSHVDRAICESEEEAGLIKIVYLKKNLKILGATIMGPAAGEMICEIGVAM
ncbi:Dihydrolipoyl dehydrogenase [Seminavis robusta]|uniref:Dihydrolipoyl dehydrogenase n=1 Tax=Seminavis robusta TaxID=568900 RepID=A0A9N8DNP0_9STRA|nr:Dihydrolipoyl dehydrogenase [Seminavis robusta]|eukprot:Sro230_g093420.1 Dihydrolipoyl dehydrogenase (483) ;mRNA; r:67183-68721